ncbi:polysaccharide deacetylase family protein [Sinomonas sp. ASV486]|uniref:polysaccharide deacetylase family protein n=1 Tax=Sinomonas sp. ASV486 TaxID=3051170 RepID=UPI0027DB5C96|nr:polysaccharide deacetylase family protein [Sinomonas sp. ASV486]MDQ4491824.1 polysaccharide deacetylase family protein [Sinomonas sp. ASV486]
MEPTQLTRRAALAGLAAAVSTAAAACSAPEDAQANLAAPGASATLTPSSTPTPSATPTPAKPAFTSDFAIPPVQGGLAPVITRVVTKQPVVFLTIDDGIVKHPESLALLKQYDYPATLFLTKSAMGENPGFFTGFQKAGDRIQDHTISHDTTMSTKGYAYQLGEITGMRDYISTTYGAAPTLFRPPGGAYSPTMRKAVADAGLKAIIDWEAKANAGSMQYQVGNGLRPGDIVLMHFREEFAADLAAFRAAHQAAGLTVVRLEDFIGA